MKGIALVALFLATALPLIANSAHNRIASSAAPGLTVQFSPIGGIHAKPLTLSLSCPGAVIYYTLDGSYPTAHSRRYTGPIALPATAVVRVIAQRDGQTSRVAAQTYFINEPPTTLPLISIAIDPKILYHPTDGWFIDPPTRRSLQLSRSEVPANVAIYEPDGRCVHQAINGLRVFGGMSRLFPQKSLVISARKPWGAKRIHHRFFGPAGPRSFKFLTLRNGGSDFGSTHLRDPLITETVKNWNVVVQGYRPVQLYLNGRYWGIYQVREKINRHFLAAHFDVPADSIDLLEHYDTQLHGSRQNYRQLLRYLSENDPAQPQHYAKLAAWMDLENFIDHQIAQIYFDNRDAGGNIRFFRPQRPPARWRWILYDTDWGMGLHDPQAYAHNSLLFHTRPDGPRWPNPPWSTFILRRLLRNADFRRQFVNRFADYLNTTLRTDSLRARIDAGYEQLAPAMPRHLARWGLTLDHWNREVARLYEFAAQRPAHQWTHLGQYFGATQTATIHIAPAAHGRVILNRHLHLGDQAFSGAYFSKYPIHLEAIPAMGYRFSHWTNSNQVIANPSLTLKLPPGDTLRLRPVFVRHRDPREGQIVINEIFPSAGAAGDWLEIFNRDASPRSLAGWSLRDRQGNALVFPDVTLPARGYLVVCQNLAGFREKFPAVVDCLGGLNFGLHRQRETLELISPDQRIIDSVHYALPDLKTRFSYQLVLPYLDNAQAKNWRVTFSNGTPALPNPQYFRSQVQPAQFSWARLGIGLGLLLIMAYGAWIWWEMRARVAKKY